MKTKRSDFSSSQQKLKVLINKLNKLDELTYPDNPIDFIEEWVTEAKPIIRVEWEEVFDDFTAIFATGGWTNSDMSTFMVASGNAQQSSNTQQQAWDEDMKEAQKLRQKAQRFLEGLIKSSPELSKPDAKRQNDKTSNATIIAAIITAIAMILVGIISYRTGIAQVETSIRATQTAEAKQTLTISTTPDVAAISDMQFRVEPYTIGNNVSSHLSIHSDKAGIAYELTYTVPQENDTYVGLFFRIDNSENLENFNYVQVTTVFEDDNTSFEMYIKDITMPWDVSTIRIGKNISYPNNVKITQEGDDYTIKIPFSVFTPLDMKAVKEIGFYAGDFSSGTHSFIIKELEFTKE